MPQVSSVETGRTASLMQVRILYLIDAGLKVCDIPDKYENIYGYKNKEACVNTTLRVMRNRGWIKSNNKLLKDKRKNTHYLTLRGTLVLWDAQYKMSKAIGFNNVFDKPNKQLKSWFKI